MRAPAHTHPAPMAPAIALAVLAPVAIFAPSRARAYEGQIGISLGAGYSVLASDTALPQHGIGAQIEIGTGLGDTFEIRGIAGYALEIDAQPLHRAHVGAELVYLVDVLEVVPFFGVGVDLPITVHPVYDPAVDFAAHAVLGFDWLFTREWSIGAEVRPYVLLTRLSADAPVWLTAIVRAQVLFEI